MTGTSGADRVAAARHGAVLGRSRETTLIDEFLDARD